ncbi:phage tail tape measure protein [Flavobacterium sp. F-380]|uniref:Phage tail tape measure protein n=1 Tax=Flavobacterium kayseriense TaxID=2764714 RepID=A0ABR7J5J1_9FLAO|nr:phage tail tape measure protein [Flavobacterium kayseriense]MBC5840737.1 phage tail tape measure protein [Flavobacterium kayseriense]MBC5846593.1 phage tail tape measure protein [Flavobacterium kayseriense]
MAAENINRRLNIYINDREVVNSMRGVGSEMARVRNQMRNLNAGADDYNEQLQELRSTYSRLTQEQARFRTEIAQTPSVLQRIRGALGPVASGMLAAFSVGALAAGFTRVLGNAKKLIQEFGQSVADLSSITGATGKDLDFLKNQAITLGKETKGGAVAVVEAYKLIASAKPELLENIDALTQMTEAVLVLSQASGLELPAAATALTDAMNQFGADASQAAMFVDTLANGAKYGSAEIPQLTESLLKFGAVAKTTNVNIQESTALIEALAEKGLKGAEAGTALRNVMLKLSAPDALPKDAQEIMKALGISFDELKDKSKPFAERLEVLKPILNDNAALIKIFGLENAVAATNLLTSTERIKELTSKMNENGTAAEQAKIRMNTLTGSLDKLESAWGSFVLSLSEKGNGLGNLLAGITNELSETIEGWRKIFTSSEKLKEEELAEIRKEGMNSIIKSYGSGNKLNQSQLEIIKKLNNEEINTNANKVRALIEQNKILASNKHWLTGAIKTENFNQIIENRKLIAEINKNSTKLLGKNQGISSLIKTKNTPLGEVLVEGSSQTTGNSSNDESKNRQKAIEDAKKHSEDLKKQLEDSQKQLLQTSRAFQDASLGSQKENYDKELALLNVEYDRKIEDTKTKVSHLKEEINKLNSDLQDPKNSKSDVQLIKAIIAAKIEEQKQYSNTVIATEQTRGFKIAALQEKYLQKSIKDQESANARLLQNLQTQHNLELGSITTLADAKAILSNYLDEEELKKVHSLSDAKKKIKEQFQKEEIELQQKHLEELVAQMSRVLGEKDEFGIELISPEEREIILAFLDEAAAKIAALGVQGATDSEDSSKDIKSLSGLDILGFTPEQWQDTFDSFDTFEDKLAAVGFAVLALQNAFGTYFQFLEAGEKRTMQKFEANNRKKQADLNDQLEKGFITQEVYTARKAKLEAELAKKKAEIEYKQAKREKLMGIASIIGNTAIGVSKALAQGGMIFGIPFAGIVAALGAVQLGLALAQPLPDKNGFYDGGFTGTGAPRSEAGPVHFNEYVVPQKVLFSNDPVVPQIMGYLEAKRTGKSPLSQDDPASTNTSSSNSGSGSNEMDIAVVNALNRNSEVLEKLEEDGLTAYLVNDIKTAKKMRDKIKEVNKLETNAKL